MAARFAAGCVLTMDLSKLGACHAVLDDENGSGFTLGHIGTLKFFDVVIGTSVLLSLLIFLQWADCATPIRHSI